MTGARVAGREGLNRAVHDDTVIVEMLPRAEWSCPSSLVLEDDVTLDDQVDEKEQVLSHTVILSLS